MFNKCAWKCIEQATGVLRCLILPAMRFASIRHRSDCRQMNPITLKSEVPGEQVELLSSSYLELWRQRRNKPVCRCAVCSLPVPSMRAHLLVGIQAIEANNWIEESIKPLAYWGVSVEWLSSPRRLYRRCCCGWRAWVGQGHVASTVSIALPPVDDVANLGDGARHDGACHQQACLGNDPRQASLIIA